MDDDGSKALNQAEFTEGMKEAGIELTDEEIQELFTRFDTDGSGSVNMDEFLVAIRVSLNNPKTEVFASESLDSVDSFGRNLSPRRCFHV